jgi:hypothetical protein
MGTRHGTKEKMEMLPFPSHPIPSHVIRFQQLLAWFFFFYHFTVTATPVADWWLKFAKKKFWSDAECHEQTTNADKTFGFSSEKIGLWSLIR